MQFMLGPDSVPGGRDTIEYREPGAGARLEIRRRPDGEPHTLFDGVPIESLQVDFHPILREAGLLGQDFIEFQTYTASESGKKRIQSAADKDRKSDRLMRALGIEGFLQKPLVEALHFDAALAAELRCCFFADPRVGRFMKAKLRESSHPSHKEDLRSNLLDVTMQLILPDFASLGWDEVIRIRESGMGRDLRRHLWAAAAEISQIVGDLDDPRDIKIVIQEHYLLELSRELRDRHPTPFKALLNLAANFLPSPVSAMGALADGVNLWEHRRSWIAMIGPQSDHPEN